MGKRRTLTCRLIKRDGETSLDLHTQNLWPYAPKLASGAVGRVRVTLELTMVGARQLREMHRDVSAKQVPKEKNSSVAITSTYAHFSKPWQIVQRHS